MIDAIQCCWQGAADAEVCFLCRAAEEELDWTAADSTWQGSAGHETVYRDPDGERDLLARERCRAKKGTGERVRMRMRVRVRTLRGW